MVDVGTCFFAVRVEDLPRIAIVDDADPEKPPSAMDVESLALVYPGAGA